MTTRTLGLLIFLTGCASGNTPPSPQEAVYTDVWAGLDDADARLSGRVPDVCDASFVTWFTSFGIRGTACLAAQVASPAELMARAPMAPFASGPHQVSEQGVRFDLGDARAFGHYDPAFVQWLSAAAVPAPETGPMRSLLQGVYERHLARRARVYWLTHQDLLADGFPASIPPGPLADYAGFLDGEAAQVDARTGEGFSVSMFTERSEGILPHIGIDMVNDWHGRYEANTAYGFWLRRRADGTHDLWLDGLRQLLSTYDADWLAANA